MLKFIGRERPVHEPFMKNIKISVFAFCLVLAGIFVCCSFKQKGPVAETAGSIQKCLIVSDIHFSPLYASTENDTVLKKKLSTSSFDQWIQYFESTPAQMALDTTCLGQDANYAVLRSAIANMKRKLPHPAFILIAGDFIWHNAVPADSALKKNTLLFIARLFKDNFPGALIVPAMGNNDTYGNDYDLQDPKFLRDFADAWQPNLPASSADSLKANGYYTCETGNLKFVVFNSAAVYANSKYPQAAPMMGWLQNNLAAANGKNVWIITHIPPGLNGYNDQPFWIPAYTQLFTNDMVKYSSTVKFMIGSHTHFNDFKVVYNDAQIPAPVSFIRIVPSVCSNHGNYPSFEVAEFSPLSGYVSNETNWYLNLRKVKKGVKPRDVIWTDSVNLKASFGLKNIRAVSLSGMLDGISADKSGHALNAYVNFYNVGTPIPSAKTINQNNIHGYLQADSLKER